jgi:uncharacterized membrane-anchored protein
MICDLENQLSNEWECHQSKKEQTFMKLESNVAAVHQKLVEEVESLRDQLEKSRSNFAEAKVNYKTEKERFEAERNMYITTQS